MTAYDPEREKNDQHTIGIQVKIGEGTTLTNLRLVYDEADQPGGIFPQGVHVDIGTPQFPSWEGSGVGSPLEGGQGGVLPFTIWADNTTDETATLVLRVVSDECHDETCPVSGQQEWETIVIDAAFSDPAPPTPPQPYLFVTPGYVETGAAHGEVTTEIVILKNQGDADLHDVSLTLLADQSGTPAPAWIALNSPAIIDVIPAGGQREVRLLFSPTAAVPEGQHSAYLRMTSPEVPSLDLGLYATVTQSGEGNVLLKVSDIYTGTLNEQGQLIQGLAGARIRIQHEVVTTVERTGSTDTAGELLLEDLPAGRYAYRITASEHYEHSGRFWIKPGLTTTQEVFLEYNVISVEWDVKEITIEDRYEVVLNTTYKTDVPAAVVVTEPASITLPTMRPGDVFQGKITFTNHGLIRADHLQVFLPEDDQYFRYELLGGLPDSLGAKQSITVPYRVTRLQTLDPGEGDGTGGGCQRYANCWKTAYDFTCANGITLERSLKTCFIAYPCSDDGDGSDGGDGGDGDGDGDDDDDDWGSWIHDGDLQPDIWKIHRGSGGGGGSGGSYSPGSGLDSGKPGNPPTELEIRDMFCYPKGPPSGPFEPNKWYVIPRDDSLTVVQKDSKQGKFSYVGCNVNTVTGMFVDQETDLAVNVPGGMINIQRTYADLNDSESDFPDVSSGPTWLIGTTGSGQFKLQGYPEDNKLGFVFLGEEPTGTVMVQVRTVEGTKFTLPPNRYRMRVKYVKDDEGNIHILGETLEYVGDPSNRTYYEHLEQKDETFITRGRTISTTNNGASWRMEDDSGNWREYDGEGFLLSSGTPNGLIEEIIYDGERKLLGIKDRNGNQVIWVEYNQQGWISEILDNSTPEPRKVTYEYVGDHLWKMTDALGVSVTYQYDDENRIEAKNDAGAGQQITVAYYDTGNYVKEVSDSRGVNRSFTYKQDGNGYYAMIEYSSNRDDSRWVEEFWYDEDGNTTHIALDGRIVKEIQRSPDGRTEVILDEILNTTTKTYDEWDNLLKVVYPNDTEVIYEYDSHFHKVTRMVDQRGTVYTYEYDDNGNMIKKTEAASSDVARTTEYVYNADGSVTKVIAPGNAVTTYTYDTAGNVTSITDPLGNIAFFWDHDAMGHVLEMEDVRGKTWTSEYDARGRQTSQTDPLGRISSTVYDAANNVTAVTAFGLTTSYGYDQWYNPETVTDALGNTTTTTYNGRNLPVLVKDPEGKQTQHYTYDGHGRLIQEQDGAENTIIYHYEDNLILLQLHRASSELPLKIEYPTYTHGLTYDEMQRVIEECDVADGEPDRCTSVTYDAGGNITTSTDAKGKTTYFKYDALNRLIWQETPDGGVTEYTYDNRDNLTWLKDPNGAITEFEYDTLNRVTKVIRPMLQEIQYEYAPNGAWKQVTLPAGQRSFTYYDTVNRPRWTDYYAPGASTPEKTVTFTYREGKNLVDSVTDGQVTISYDYDGLDRRTRETIDYGNGLTLSYSYEYYANGLTKSFTGPDGVTINYKYDENNRLQTLDIPGPGQIVVNEYEWNEPVKMIFPGGSVTEYGYNNFRELTSLVAKLPGEHAVLNEEYTYYPSGNLHTRKIPSVGTYIYEYDDAYRLKTVTNPVASNESYTYDLLGNRKTAANIDSEWEYNAGNELLGYADIEYRYDDNGNLTQVLIADKVVWTYTYDVTNRLVHVEDGTGTIKADYGYDPFGRRLWKKVGDKTTYFLYTDEGLIGEYNADGTPIRTYGYVGGEPLFLKKNGQYYWYRNDRLGTPRTLETGSGENVGKVVWSGVYDAFGNCQVTVDEVENNLRFPGQYFDKETGLYYNLNRYYDPKIGRYLQTDPAGDGLNPYAYVGGNPVNAIDPNGLCAWRMVGGVADIAAGLALTGVTGGWGAVVAWMMIVNGADNLVAGAYSMIAGEEIPSLIQSGFRRAIPNRTAADLAYMGFEIGLNVAGLAVERAAQRAVAQVVFNQPPRPLPLPLGDYVIGLSGDLYDSLTGALKSGVLKPGESPLDPWIDLRFMNPPKKLFQLWKSNKKVLLDAMSQGRPIRDISVEIIPRGIGRFLRAERALLKRHGWKLLYRGKEKFWVPPGYKF